MAEQFSNAPAPSREEFEDLAEQIGTVNSKLITVEENTLDTSNEGVLTYKYNPGLKLCIIIWHGNSTVPTAETRIKEIGLPTKLLKKGSSTPITPLIGGGYMEIDSSKAYLNLPLAAWSAGSIMYFTN